MTKRTDTNPQPTREGSQRAVRLDKEAALDAALGLFRRHGYEGVSVADLTKAMGVAPPSLYHAFGSKADLYRAVLRRYVSGRVGSAEIEAAPTARDAVELLLVRGLAAATRPGEPPGCMVSSGMLMASPDNAELAAEPRALRAAVTAALERRIRRDIGAGLLARKVDAAATARFYICVLQGLSTAALDGVPVVELKAVVALALSAWPQPKPIP